MGTIRRNSTVTALTVTLILAAVLGCFSRGAPPPGTDEARRLRMVADQIERRGVTDQAVIAAMKRVPRHQFVPREMQALAYEDAPLPIGEGQTISQPLIVAMMTAAIRPKRGMKVLEIGTGSGYQAAVLSECVGQVFTIEVIPALGRRAEAVLKRLGYQNVHVRVGDGYDGWPAEAPFDAVVLTAAPERVPKPLLDQLKVGGRLVAPVGRGVQDLVLMMKTERGVTSQVIDAVRFVPMTGKAAGATSRKPQGQSTPASPGRR